MLSLWRRKFVELSSRQTGVRHGWSGTLLRFNDSQSAGMIDERPGDFESFRQMRRQCFHPERLRGIVSAVKNVHAQLLSQRESPVRPFAGDEGVHAFARGPAQFA